VVEHLALAVAIAAHRRAREAATELVTPFQPVAATIEKARAILLGPAPHARADAHKFARAALTIAETGDLDAVAASVARLGTIGSWNVAPAHRVALLCASGRPAVAKAHLEAGDARGRLQMIAAYLRKGEREVAVAELAVLLCAPIVVSRATEPRVFREPRMRDGTIQIPLIDLAACAKALHVLDPSARERVAARGAAIVASLPATLGAIAGDKLTIMQG
jgi:hypothetical protein